MSTQVTNEPELISVGKATRRFSLGRPFIVYADAIADWITVPAGFVTDLNSTPRGLWNLLPPWDYPEAAVAHDYLYQHGASNTRSIERGEADRVHRELLQWAEAPAWKIRLYYIGLRAGGWAVWRRYRQGSV
jgi:hypothetical protein